MVNGAVPRFWREIPQRYNLIGNQCEVCKKIFFPPRESCPTCRRKSIGKMRDVKLNGKGKARGEVIGADKLWLSLTHEDLWVAAVVVVTGKE